MKFIIHYFNSYCRGNGIPLSATLLYLKNVLYWPEYDRSRSRHVAIMWPGCIYFITIMIYFCVLTVYNTIYKFDNAQRDGFCQKKNVLYFWRPLDVSKFVLWFVIGYLVSPGSSGSPCAKICIGIDGLNAALSSGMTSLQVMFVWARRVGWGSNKVVIPLSCTLSKCYDVQYGNTIDSPNQPYSPFTQQITLYFLYCFSGLWAFCQAVILLTYIVATKIGSCKLDLCLIIHILGFITPNFFPICLMIMENLAVFQAWIWVWVGIGNCLISSQIRHMVRLYKI